MSRNHGLPDPLPRLPAEKAEEVRGELERVLGSPLFRASRRYQGLLRRIVDHTLAGDTDNLKERALGVEVFGLAADFDTGDHPVVRVSAAEIRKKLAQYYQESGHESEIRIDLPPGSYVAEFHFASVQTANLQHPPQRQEPRPRKRTIIAVLATAGVILVAGVTAIHWRHSDLDDLWRPVLKAPGTVLVCIGFQPAFNPRSAQAQDKIEGILKTENNAAAAQRPIREEDLILLRDRYVALDDAVCLVRVTSLLERYRKPYRIRAEQSTSFADLRDTPAVLIGAFDNPWTLRTADQLRFTFRKDSAHDTGMVYDSRHPENSQWKLANYWPNWDVPVDYAIVTRMVDSTTDRPVMIAAGLTQYGTTGAGELLSDAKQFSEVARDLPRGWSRRNLQIVLRVPVVNHIAGHPTILATHVW